MTTRDERAKRRRETWRGFVSRSGVHPPMGSAPPELALSVMWETAVEAWLMAGHELPVYARSEMPGRVIRRPGGAKSE